MGSFDKENNLHDNWIEEIKDRVNSMETELLLDGFDAIMNTIKQKRHAKIVKLICYSAAAAVIIAIIPTLYFSNSWETGYPVVTDKEDKIAVITKPATESETELLYIAQNSEVPIRKANTGNDILTEHVATENAMGENNLVKENLAENNKAENNLAENAVVKGIAAKSIATESSATEEIVAENSTEEAIAATENITTQTQSRYEERSAAKKNFTAKNINLTFSDQAEWDEADAATGKRGRKRDGYREEKRTSIALNAGNAAGGGMFLGDDYENGGSARSSTDFVYNLNNGVNKVDNKGPNGFANSAFSVKEKNLSHFTGVRENKINLTGGKYNHKLPLRFGLTVAIPLSDNVYFETGLSYSYLRSDIKVGSEKLSQKLHYIGVPVNFNWYFINKEHLGLYIGAGMSVNKCISASIGRERFGIGKFESSANIQAGFLGKISRSVGIYVQPGVNFRLSGKDLTTFEEFTVQNYYSDKDFSITFDGGLRFSF